MRTLIARYRAARAAFERLAPPEALWPSPWATAFFALAAARDSLPRQRHTGRGMVACRPADAQRFDSETRRFWVEEAERLVAQLTSSS